MCISMGALFGGVRPHDHDLLLDKRTRNTFAAGNTVAKQHLSTAVNNPSVQQ